VDFGRQVALERALPECPNYFGKVFQVGVRNVPSHVLVPFPSGAESWESEIRHTGCKVSFNMFRPFFLQNSLLKHIPSSIQNTLHEANPHLENPKKFKLPSIFFSCWSLKVSWISLFFVMQVMILSSTQGAQHRKSKNWTAKKILRVADVVCPRTPVSGHNIHNW